MITIPGYQVHECIHEGKTTSIFQGVRHDGAKVYVKVLRTPRPTAVQLAWLRREFEIQRDLEGAGTVKAYPLERWGTSWALVVEDFGGQSLDRLLATRSFSLADRLRVAIAITAAVGQLHTRKVIHKHLCPANIVWNPETNTVKLIDLGIATLLSRESAQLRGAESIEGTLAYLSPEQTGRLNRSIDSRSDFYSLGATLYELFTGAPPFRSDDLVELVHCHIARRPTDPYELNPSIPKVISDIVMRLLEKMPENRYQSAFGLQADLEKCLELLTPDSSVEFFPLGSRDVVERFNIPQMLYGRDKELAVLLSVFDEVANNSTAALALVTGYSGVGKSSLVKELYRPITERRGYFISGKFEQLQRTTPYSALVAALTSLMRQVLGESESSLARYRKLLLDAVGANGRVLFDFAPELELIIGPQPPIQQLEAQEAQNRFNLVFSKFLAVFAQPAHPLTIFLDDLQWADLASLKLLEQLFRDDTSQCLFVIGAYRDHEVGPGHPLLVTLDALAKRGLPIRRTPLAPLELEGVTLLVADTVACPASQAAELARIIAQKTEGNPLFVTELLKSLHEEGLLHYDPQEGHWSWDVAIIAKRGLADNVVDLVLGKLRRLDQSTQETLQVAASLGGSFDLDSLSIALSITPPEAFRRVLPAIREGFVLGENDLVIADESDAESPFVVRNLRFTHDRVQQAAYALISEDERRSVHLRIGRRLLEAGALERRDGLFQIVDQMNRGIKLLESEVERLNMARLNLEAGKQARKSLAYAAAKSYLDFSLELLPSECWKNHYNLAFNAHKELCEIEYLNGEYEACERLCLLTLDQTHAPVEKAEIYFTLVNEKTMRGRYDEALQMAKDGLALLDIDLPFGASAEEIEKLVASELAKVRVALGSRAVESLLHMTAMTDPAALMGTTLLRAIVPPAYFTNLPLYCFTVLKGMELSLRFGPSPRALDLFSQFGVVLSGLLGDYATGYQFGKLAIDLADIFSRLDVKCMSAHNLADNIAPWSRPLRESWALNVEAFQVGIEGGDTMVAGYALCCRPSINVGENVDELAAELRESLKFCEKTRNFMARDICMSFAIISENLGGQTSSHLDFRYGDLDETTFLTTCEQKTSLQAICCYHMLKSEALFIYGDPEGSAAASAKAKELVWTLTGSANNIRYSLYSTLSLIGCWEKATPEWRSEHSEKLHALLEQWGKWAVSCPANFAHLHALISAEMARVDGKPEKAIELYDCAIDGARREGFVRHEALAAWLAGKFWIARDREHVAKGYMRTAHATYKRNGALRKTILLEREYPNFFAPEDLPQAHESQLSSPAPQDAPTSATNLDLQSILKLSYAITSEIDLDRLLSKLMLLLLENAGARHGALVFEKNGDLQVEVHAAVDETQSQGSTTTVLQSIALPDFSEASEPIIRYVARTKEPMILGDATREGAFTQTPYVLHAKPKSLLCIPVMNSGRLVAIAYLENNLSTNVFTPERLEILRLLSAQIATSLDIAILHRELETRVALRTSELNQRNEDLSKTLNELRKTQNQLVQSEKMASMGRLSMGIAHELKNPLNFIINFAKIENGLVGEIEEELNEVRDNLPANSGILDTVQDLKDAAEAISEHGTRANDIVQSMMRHAVGMSGERTATRIDNLLDQAIKFVLESPRVMEANAKINIERNYDATIGEVLIVAQEILRVCINLLENAVDAVFTKKSSTTDAYVPTIHINAQRTARSVIIRVRDTGSGIAAAILPRVFEPFFTTKAPGMGLGLGLSLSYDIVVQGHHGTLECESVEEQGATFVMTLPT